MEQKNKKLDLPFEGPYKTKPSAVPGKHGIGFSTARHLARQGMAQQVKKAKTNEDNEQGVAEAKDPREYDYEGDMAKSQLRSIIMNAQQVHDMLEDDTNMAEWVQSKITLATDYISTVADYMAAEMKEEVEPIEELSKSTLGSYIKKASQDSTISRKIGADFEHQAKRAIRTSMKNASTEVANKFKSKSWKRQDNVNKAVDRLTAEEVEQVDELNKDTLHSYAKKSEKDQDVQFNKVGIGIRDKDPKSANKAGHKFSMRSIGQNRADKRLSAVSENTFKSFRDQIAEKHLTPAEMKKREEIAKAIHKEKPGMPMGDKMAVATASAKKAA